MTGTDHSVGAEGPLEAPKLPNMNEFSPGTLDTDIQALLALVAAGKGDKDAVVQALIARYPRIQRTPDPKQRKGRASNVLIGMSQCGLVEKSAGEVTVKLTDVAERILHAASPQDAAFAFGKHLVENCYGAELIDVVAMVRARALPVTLENIRDELEDRGFEVTENEGNASKIRMWLEPSGIIDSHWVVDDARLHMMVGAASGTLAEWYSLSRPQRIFLQMLRELAQGDTTHWQIVRKAKRLGEERFGRHAFPTGRLRDKVIEPLRIAGWLDARGSGAGRGGDSGEVLPLAKLCDISITLPLDDTAQVPSDLRPLLSTPLDVIFSDLKSTNIDVKGRALELLALNILRDLGLVPVGFRVRSARTQGAEVDVIGESVSVTFGRWLVQCKNTPRSSLEVDQIAKEVGMAVVLKANVVVMVTTGKIGKAVRTFADGLAQTTSLQAILIDGPMLETYRKSRGAGLVDLLHDSAQRTLRIKRSQIIEQPE